MNLKNALKLISLRASIFLGIIIFLFGNVVFSQSPEYSVYYKKFDSSQGLSNNDVFDIHKDTFGIVWIGTRAGVNRFDGKGFDMPLGGNTKPVHRIEEDSEGFLWLIETHEAKISHVKSISFLDVFSKKIISSKERFEEIPFDWNQLYTLRKNKFGTFFLGLKSGKIFTFHPATGFRLIPFEAENFLLRDFDFHNENQFWVLSVDHKKKLSKWILLDLDGTVIIQKVMNHLGGWRRIGSDGNQKLWYLNVGLKRKARIFSFDSLGNFQKHALNIIAPEIPDTMILHWLDLVEFFQPQQYFFTSFNREAKLYERFTKRLIYDFSVLPDFKNQIWRKPFYDTNGDIWMPCSNGFFIVKIERNKFSRFLVDGDFTPSCRGICAVNDTLLIANTYKGTYLLNSEKPSFYKEMEKLDEVAIPVIKDDNENIWFGAAEKIFFWDTKADTVSKISLSIPSFFDHIRSLIELPDGNIGFTGTRTIGWINPDTKAIYRSYVNGNVANSQLFGAYATDFLTDGKLYGIQMDREQNLWCVSNSGLFLFDFEAGIQEKFGEDQTGKNYLPAKDFRDLFQDKEGIYWLATGTRGLIRWDRQEEKIEQFSNKKGLNTNSLYGILEDDFDNLWVSSDQGIIQFNKTNKSGIAWLPQSGTTSEEFNWGSKYQSSDGAIYFGSLDGITKFHPRDFLSEQKKLPDVKIKIVEFEKFDNATGKFENKTKDFLKEHKITLHPSDGNFRLRFLADDYFNQEQIIYSTQIEGLHTAPTESKSNEIKYGRLPFGNYLLRIKGKLPNGQFSKNELTIPIEVVRRNANKYLLVSAFGLILLLIIGWAYFRYASSKKSLLEKDKEKDDVKEPVMESMSESDRVWLEKLDKITVKNLPDFNLSVDTLAIEMNLGRTVFFSKVKQITGLSPKLYLQETRLKMAKTYLESGQKKSVKATAYAVGIKDVKYFSRIFKKRFDVLPSKLLSSKY